MRILLFVFCLFALTALTQCKKYCYQCTQYCAYCVNANDSAIAYKVCATNEQGNTQINAVMATYEDSGYVCNLLNNQANICDNKNSIANGVTYYEEENYYCVQQ